MDFNRRKLSREEGSRLRVVKPHTVQAYALLPAPLYVFLQRNEKYVSIKGPLDFFTPEELQRFSDIPSFYYPEFVERVLAYRDNAVRVDAILRMQPLEKQTMASGGVLQVSLPLAPFEVSDALLRVVGPLWGSSVFIEPFFPVFFVDHLCDPLPSNRMVEAREAQIERFERAVLLSSLMIFLSIHLGAPELSYLNDLRIRSFEKALGDEVGGRLRSREEIELFQICEAGLEGDEMKRLNQSWFAMRQESTAKKIAYRLGRVVRDLSKKSQATPTLYGDGGLLSA